MKLRAHTPGWLVSLSLACGVSAAAPVPPAAPADDTVEILAGSNPACDTLRRELTAHWQSHGFDEEPEWKDHDPDFVFPPELGYGQQADVDFYNDGRLARVFLHYYESPGMRGSSLLVQPGHSVQSVAVSGSDPLEDPESWLIPCQLQGKRFPLRECAPFSTRSGDTGLTVSWAGYTRRVRFRSRYMDLALIRLNDTTFIVATGSTPESQGFAALLKPLPYRTFSLTCLLHRR